MRVRKGLGNLILLALEKTIDGSVRIDHLLNNPSFYAYKGGWDYPLNKPALSQALKRLREGGLIEFVDDKKLVVRLTDPGKEQAVWGKLQLEEKSWDGKWRVVIFDIPEKRRIARDILRSKLKEWGFKQLQKSVWACKKNCTKELRDFIKKVGIEDWVMVIESDNMGRDLS